MLSHAYLKEGKSIYERSFEIIRAEANLQRFDQLQSRVVVRMIHACGCIDLANFIEFGHDFAAVTEKALHQGATIWCDAEMVAAGITRSRLPQNNAVICTLNAPETPVLAKQLQTTRSAAALHLWQTQFAGNILVIGNAPTALFHLLTLLSAGVAPPLAIVGVPVGFVGAAESKQALQDYPQSIPYVIVKGRLGGSAIASASINALASSAL